MTEQVQNNQGNKNKSWPIYLILIFLIAIVGYTVYSNNSKEPKLEQPIVDTTHSHTNGHDYNHAEAPEVITKNNTITLNDIVESRKTWDVMLPEWIGKDAPDFTVKKLDGSEFKLSAQKGKNVLIVFWATWCGYCVTEIPHFNVLIKDLPSSDLSLIAISDEQAEVVRDFAAKKGINYPVATTNAGFRQLPSPFNQIDQFGRPAAAFVDKEGKIKLMTIGSMGLTETKQIIKAE